MFVDEIKQENGIKQEEDQSIEIDEPSSAVPGKSIEFLKSVVSTAILG